MPITFSDVTPQDATDLAHILIAGNESFRGYVPDKCLDFSVQESAKNWETMLRDGLQEGDFMFFARNSEGIPVGYSWGGPYSSHPDYKGELKQIAILPELQRQGIGLLMVQEVVRRLALQSIHSMCVHVLEVNPNRLFYERLGGKYVSKYPFDWDGFKTISFVYGWKDTRILSNS